MKQTSWFLIGCLCALLLITCSDESDSKNDSGSNIGSDAMQTDGLTSVEGPPAVNGFGAVCAPVANPCPGQGLTCYRELEDPSGICTKTCPTLGDPCSGTAEGAYAECGQTLQPSGQHLCVFLCGQGAHSYYRCPQGTTCDEQNQMQNGLFRCSP